ncbi:hypothetical protein JCM10449v2_003954 [Rhodotorula kratochvilovae]
MFSAAGTTASDLGRTLLPRSTTSRDIVGTYDGSSRLQVGGAGDGRRGSDASISRFSAGNGARSEANGEPAHGRERSSTFASTVSGTTASSLFPRDGHDRYPSSATSGPAERSSSLYRTASNTTSSSTGSSDYPRTPAQAPTSPGAVVYRSTGSHSPLPLFASSRKGKERAHDVDRDQPRPWQAGVPVLSSPVGSPTRPLPSMTSSVRGRTQGPAIIDPRFSFPMRRGGPNSSGSGSGSGGGSRQGITTSRSQPVGLGFRSAMPDVLEGQRVSSEEMRRRGSAGSALGESSFVASLAARPLVDDHGHGLTAHYPSYAASPADALLASPRSSPSSSAPSLIVPSPVLPTSPITSAFTTPEAPASATLLPAFQPKPPQPPTKPTKRSNFKRRRRTSPKSRARLVTRNGCRSSSSSASSAGHRSLRIRSASLPNLRDAANNPVEPFRRPSIPLEPRGPRTRSPQAERRSRDSVRSGSTPLIFPSKPVGTVSRHRAHASESHARSPPKPPIPPRTKRNVVPVSRYETIIRTRPRLVVVDASPATSAQGSDEEEALRAPALSARARGKQPARRGALTDADVELFDDAANERSSVRRVLLENELSRAEREAWSDSAMRGVGFGLSLRLAEREQKEGRRSLAAEQRRAERRRMRQEVARRKRREAAEAESEPEGRLRPQRRAGPDYSPPMPSSFEPFAQFGRKLSLTRSRERERRSSTGGAVSDGAGLGIVNALKRTRSKRHNRIASAASTAEAPPGSEGPTTPRTVRGQAIRHLQTSPSVDSLYLRTQASAPTLPPLPTLGTTQSLAAAVHEVTTQYGQALTSPGDQPFQPVGERRRPSATAQNAFLSLPPRLHHLLRSPERESYTPSRPAPTVPVAALPLDLQEELSRVSTPDSAVSAACLSLALEEHLRETSGGKSSAAKSLEDLPVATTAPLVWRAREPSPHLGAPSPSRLSTSRSAPALASAAGLSPSSSEDRLSPRFDHPFAQGSTASGRVRRMPSQLSRQSSASSVVDLTNDGNWNELFFLQPRRRGSARHHPSPSIETIESVQSVDAPPSDTSRDFRLRSVVTSPFEVFTRPSSHASYYALESSQDRTPADSGTVAGAPEQLDVMNLPHLAPLAFVRQDSSATRPSTSQTAYLTAEEGASSVSSSPDRPRLPLPSPPASTGRPLPTPMQSTWASTSFAREYLGTNSSLDSPSTARLSGGSGSGGSNRSFLRIAEGSESEQDRPVEPSRRAVTSDSFMDFGSPPSSAPTSPRQSLVPNGLVAPFSPALSSSSPILSRSATPVRPNHERYLSINSTHFVNPLRRTSISPLVMSDGSRFSTLDETMDDFPAPPQLGSGTEESGSDGDDEDEGDEVAWRGDSVTIRHRPISIASLPVHAPSASVPDIAAFPVVGDRPVSSTSWLDFSDSEGR